MHATASRAGAFSFLVPAGIHGFCPELPHGEVPRGAPAEELLWLRDRRAGRKVTACQALMHPWVASFLVHGALLGWLAVLSHAAYRHQTVRKLPPAEPIKVVWSMQLEPVAVTSEPVFKVLDAEVPDQPWAAPPAEVASMPSAISDLSDVPVPNPQLQASTTLKAAKTPAPAACFNACEFRKPKPAQTANAGAAPAFPGVPASGGANTGLIASQGTDASAGHASGNGTTKIASSGNSVPSRGSARYKAARPNGGNPAPRYPEDARKQGQAGLVLIWIEVLADGRVGNVRIASSSGFAMLDAAALDAARRWKFKPAEAQGQAVRSEVEVPFDFTLKRGR